MTTPSESAFTAHLVSIPNLVAGVGPAYWWREAWAACERHHAQEQEDDPEASAGAGPFFPDSEFAEVGEDIPMDSDDCVCGLHRSQHGSETHGFLSCIGPDYTLATSKEWLRSECRSLFQQLQEAQRIHAALRKAWDDASSQRTALQVSVLELTKAFEKAERTRDEWKRAAEKSGEQKEDLIEQRDEAWERIDQLKGELSEATGSVQALIRANREYSERVRSLESDVLAWKDESHAWTERANEARQQLSQAVDEWQRIRDSVAAAPPSGSVAAPSPVERSNRHVRWTAHAEDCPAYNTKGRELADKPCDCGYRAPQPEQAPQAERFGPPDGVFASESGDAPQTEATPPERKPEALAEPIDGLPVPPCDGLTGTEWRRREEGVIRAAEGMTLEPGEYAAGELALHDEAEDLKPGDRFSVGGSYSAQTNKSGEWFWVVRGSALTAVRRAPLTEPEPVPESGGAPQQDDHPRCQSEDQGGHPGCDLPATLQTKSATPRMYFCRAHRERFYRAEDIEPMPPSLAMVAALEDECVSATGKADGIALVCFAADTAYRKRLEDALGMKKTNWWKPVIDEVLARFEKAELVAKECDDLRSELRKEREEKTNSLDSLIATARAERDYAAELLGAQNAQVDELRSKLHDHEMEDAALRELLGDVADRATVDLATELRSKVSELEAKLESELDMSPLVKLIEDARSQRDQARSTLTTTEAKLDEARAERDKAQEELGSEVACPNCHDGSACLPGGCGIEGCERCGKSCETCGGKVTITRGELGTLLAALRSQLSTRDAELARVRGELELANDKLFVDNKRLRGALLDSESELASEQRACTQLHCDIVNAWSRFRDSSEGDANNELWDELQRISARNPHASTEPPAVAAPAVAPGPGTEAQHYAWALDLLAERLRAHLPTDTLSSAMRYVIQTREQLCGGTYVTGLELVPGPVKERA